MMATIARSLSASLAILAAFAFTSFAQRAPKLAWQQCYGGSGLENSRQFLTPHSHMMVHTSDGGYAFVAVTNSYDAPVTGNHHDTTGNPTFDFWLVKLDAAGKMEWEHCYGGSGDESPRCLIQTSDGGYAMCGTTRSHDGDVTDSHPTGSYNDLLYVNDAWIVKTDASGNKEWAHSYGWTQGDEYFNSIIEVPDGYVAVGLSTTVDGAPEGHILDSKLNQGDAFVIKINLKGEEQWRRLYGDNLQDEASEIIPFPGGGYIFVGNYDDPNGPILEEPWVVRIDTGGVLVWQKHYNTPFTTMTSIIRTSTGFLIAGGGMYNSYDAFLMSIDTSGNPLNSAHFGGSGYDIINSVISAQDSNFLFAGATRSPEVPGIHLAVNEDTVLHNTDSTDAWVGEFTPDLKLVWQRAMGGDFRDWFYTVLENDDRSIMLYGGAESGNQHDGGNGDHPGNVNGYSDAWIVKLQAPSNSVARYSDAFGIAAYPNPAQSIVNVELNPNSAVCSVEFYDLLGNQVYPEYRIHAQVAAANVQQLPAGVYVIKVTYKDRAEQVQRFLHTRF